MTKQVFSKPFTQQEAIPEAGIARAVEIMKTGRLHRYNLLPDEAGEAAALEMEYAKWQGADYCIACTSGGYAIQLGLRVCGVKPGDKVLANAYTLAPVPGAIHNVGGVPVLVDIDESYHIDCDDLDAKAAASGAKYLLLSYMRGHIPDMDKLLAVCAKYDICLIEDCAHTMGAKWRGIRSGNFGKVAAFSTQTYKHMNSGEGGFLISDDAQVMARAIMLSGSYMLYEKHLAAPPPEAFETLRYETPNISGRMDHLRAAILRPQLRRLDAQCEAWNSRYQTVEAGLQETPGLSLVPRPAAEKYVGSSFQFLLLDWPPDAVQDVLGRCAGRGVELKWFGGAEPSGFTSRYDSWRYAESAPMPKSDRILAGLIDMRIPLTFSLEDCALIARIIRAEVSAVYQAA